MFTEPFSQIFPQNVLGLDVVSGRIYESQFLSDEEQEVFAGFTIKESNKMSQAHETWQEQNSLCNVDGKMEDCLDQQ